VVRAWVKLTPSLLRVAIRRGRHLRPSRRTDSRTARPLVVDRREVGTISSHDDVGTSTAEIRAMLVDEIDAAAAQSVINSVTSEAFARGNHRAAWTVCESQLALVSALQSQGFTPEGLAAPPLGDTRDWQTWSRLNTEVPSTSNTEVPSTSNTQVPSTSNTEVPSTSNTQVPSTSNTQVPG